MPILDVILALLIAVGLVGPAWSVVRHPGAIGRAGRGVVRFFRTGRADRDVCRAVTVIAIMLGGFALVVAAFAPPVAITWPPPPSLTGPLIGDLFDSGWSFWSYGIDPLTGHPVPMPNLVVVSLAISAAVAWLLMARQRARAL